MNGTSLISEKRMCTLADSLDGKRVYWTDNIEDELPVVYSPNGDTTIIPETIPETFIKSASRHPHVPALQVTRNKVTYTWTKQQYLDDVKTFAKAIMSLQIKQKTAINIIGFNSPEWFIAWLGNRIM